jgi:hypothetical protein
MAEPKKRTIHLTGLGESLEDRIRDLREVGSAARSSEDKAEINRLAARLQETKDAVFEFCRAWSREFDMYE